MQILTFTIKGLLIGRLRIRYGLLRHFGSIKYETYNNPNIIIPLVLVLF